MKIVKYGIGQKPHVNIKFQCSYCQTKFIADEFDYTILTKSKDYYEQYVPEDTSVITETETITEEAKLLEMLQYTPIAECECPVCHQVVHKELHKSDDPDINKIVQGVSMAVLLVTAVLLMILAGDATDDKKFSIAILPIMLATFCYCGAFVDE